MSTTTTQNAAATQWAEPGIGPAWRYKFFYWLMRLGGTARGYHLAYFAAFWYVLLYPSIRKRCGFYLQRRFPDRNRWYQRLADANNLVRSYAITLVDIMVLNMFGPGHIAANCPQHDQLIQRCARPQGFVLLHAHVGCFQIGVSALAQFPKKVSIVMIPEPGNRLGNSTIIDPRAGLAGVIQMTDALLRGEIVTMMGDRIFGSDQNVVPVRFLGGTTRFPITPYRLASATGVPILVMTAPKITKTSYELRVEKIIDVPPNLGRSADDYIPYAQQYADCIEKFTRDFPWQVYNFYDLWL